MRNPLGQLTIWADWSLEKVYSDDLYDQLPIAAVHLHFSDCRPWPDALRERSWAGLSADDQMRTGHFDQRRRAQPTPGVNQETEQHQAVYAQIECDSNETLGPSRRHEFSDQYGKDQHDDAADNDDQ